MTAISVSERLLEMAAFYTPLALTVTFIQELKLPIDRNNISIYEKLYLV